MSASYVLGVDVGGTKLSTVLATRTGKMVHKIRRPTCVDRGSAFGMARLCEMLDQTLAETGVDPADVLGIGVACGSPLDAEKGIILGPPNLSTWNPVPIKALLESRFGLYTQLENDANAGALAEWLFGAGRGKRHVVYMTMGTGIGGGMILDGALYRGASGYAGEIGHMRVVHEGGPLCGCGKRGCLEAFCSGPAIARRTQRAVVDHPDSAILALAGSAARISAEHLFAAARQNDPLAVQLVDETAHYLGIGLANIAQVFNPEVIVLGTIATQQGDFFLDRVRRVVQQETWPQVWEAVEILASPLGSQVGDYGAIGVLLSQWI